MTASSPLNPYNRIHCFGVCRGIASRRANVLLPAPALTGFQRLAPEPRRRNVSSDLHPYERTTPPIIESEFLQSNNRGSEKYRVLSL